MSSSKFRSTFLESKWKIAHEQEISHRNILIKKLRESIFANVLYLDVNDVKDIVKALKTMVNKMNDIDESKLFHEISIDERLNQLNFNFFRVYQ